MPAHELTPEEVNTRFNEILRLIGEKGLPLRKALKKQQTSSEQFYKWIKQDELRHKEQEDAKKSGNSLIDSISETIGDLHPDSTVDRMAVRYARACEERRTLRFEEIERIAKGEKTKRYDSAAVQRDRLRVDALKWQLSKEDPKKYGDKVDVTTGNNPLPAALQVGVLSINPLMNDTPANDNRNNSTP